MIPFKIFAPVLIGLTGIGWVISGVVQKPAPKTIRDFLELGNDGRCIKKFLPDRFGIEPKINCQNSGGGSDCCKGK